MIVDRPVWAYLCDAPIQETLLFEGMMLKSLVEGVAVPLLIDLGTKLIGKDKRRLEELGWVE